MGSNGGFRCRGRTLALVAIGLSSKRDRGSCTERTYLQSVCSEPQARTPGSHPCDWSGMENVPISGSCIYIHVQNPLFRKVMYSQVLEISIRMSLRGHHSANDIWPQGTSHSPPSLPHSLHLSLLFLLSPSSSLSSSSLPCPPSSSSASQSNCCVLPGTPTCDLNLRRPQPTSCGGKHGLTTVK